MDEINKKELVRRVAEKTNIQIGVASQVIEQAFESITEILEQGGKVRISRFGVFEIRWREARRGVDPRDGNELHIDRMPVAGLKVGTVLKSRIREHCKKEV